MYNITSTCINKSSKIKRTLKYLDSTLMSFWIKKKTKSAFPTIFKNIDIAFRNQALFYIIIHIACILRYAYICCIRFNIALSRLYADESDKEESENWRVPAETTMMSAPRNSWSTWLGGCRPRLTSPSPAPCCSCTFSRTRCTREDRWEMFEVTIRFRMRLFLIGWTWPRISIDTRFCGYSVDETRRSRFTQFTTLLMTTQTICTVSWRNPCNWELLF